jgi:hypothetical protein
MWCLEVVFCRGCGNKLSSENMLFCIRCHPTTDDSTDVMPENTALSIQNETEQKASRLNKKRSGGTWKIIGGVILILIGIAGAGYGLLAYNVQLNDMQSCNSTASTFNQSDPNYANSCNESSGYLNTGVLSGSIGVILLIIGIILIASGMKQKSK